MEFFSINPPLKAEMLKPRGQNFGLGFGLGLVTPGLGLSLGLGIKLLVSASNFNI